MPGKKQIELRGKRSGLFSLNRYVDFKGPAILAVISFLAFSTLFGLLVYQRYQLMKETEDREILKKINEVKENIQETINQSLSVAKTLAFTVDADGNVNNFDSVAPLIMATAGDIDALQLVPSGIISYVYPKRGNEIVLGYNILEDSTRNKDAFRAVAEKRMYFAGPLQLKQGGMGIVGRLALFRKNKFWGFSAVVIKMKTLLKTAGIDSTGKSGYLFQLSKINPDTREREYFLSPISGMENSHSVDVNVPNGEWQLSIKKVLTNSDSWNLNLFILLAFLLSLIGAVFIYSITSQPKKLKELVKARTVELQSSKNKYQSLIERVSDAFVAIDTGWNYSYVNKKAGELLWREPLGLIGKNIWEEFPEENKRPTFQAYTRALETQEFQHIEEFYPSFNKWLQSDIYPSKDGLSVFIRDVTEIKKITQALESSEEKYRSLIEQASDGIVITNLHGIILEVNKSIKKMLGYSEKDLLGKHIRDFIPETELEKIPLRINELMQGKSLLYERRLLRKDGTTMEVEINSKMASFSTLIGFIRDITERKKYEQELTYQATLLESVSDAITSLNMDRQIVTWNKACEELFGFKAAEALGKRVPELVKFEYADTTNEAVFEQVYKTGSWKGEFVFYHPKTNERIYLLSSISLLKKIHKDEPTGFIITSKNISERKTAEEEIKKSNERYQSLLDNLDAGVVVHAADTSIVTANPKACQLLGLTEHQLKGKNAGDPVWSFMNADNQAIPEEQYPVNQIKKSGKSVRNLVMAMNRLATNDVIWLIVNGFPVFNTENEITEIVVSFIDITDLKTIEFQKAKERTENEVLINNTSDLLWSVSKDYRLIAANTAFIEGLRENSGVTLQWGDDVLLPQIASAEYLLYWKEIYGQGLSGKKITTEIYTPQAGSSDYLWFELKIDPIIINNEITGIACSMRNITERKKIADEVTKANERFELIAEATNDAVWDHDFTLDETWGNKKLFDLYGIKPGEQKINFGMFLERIHPDDRKGIEERMRNAVGKKLNSIAEEFRFRNADGEYRNYYDRALIMYDEVGRPVKILGAMLDITDREKSKKAILESEEKFRTMIEQASDGIFIADADTFFIDVNSAGCRLTGYSLDELKKMRFTDIVPPEDVETNPLLITKMNAGESVVNERRIRKKDGTIIDVEISAKKLLDGRYQSIGRDITERKKVAAELMESEKKYKLLFYNNPLPMWMTTLPGLDIIDVNDAAIKQYGYSREEFLKLNTRQLRPEEDVENFLNEVAKMKPDRINIRNWRHKKKDGTIIHVETYSHEIVYQGKPVWLGLSHDVTEKVEARNMLQKSYEEIRQLASNLQSIREDERTNIAREIHDELGQQLTGLKMDLHWLARKIANEEKSVTEKMKESIDLINATITSVRKIATDLRPSILDDLGLTAALEWQGEEFQKRSGTRVEFINKAGSVSVQPEAATGIFRIYQELLTNIARHASATKVIACLTRDENCLNFSVIDNGIGFDPETISRKKTLGLLGIKERTLLLGGTYTVTSNQGKGSEIIISIPLKLVEIKN